MPKKGEENVAGKRLRQVIDEALREKARKQENRPIATPPTAWPPWPYVDLPLETTAKVSEEIGSPSKSKKEIDWRLKQIEYPFPEGNRNHKTFYQHVESLGLLGALRIPPLLSQIRNVWWFQRDYAAELELWRRGESPYGLPLEFHRKAMFECAAHLHRLDTLALEYKIHQKRWSRSANRPRGQWFDEYRKATLNEILREAAVYYPQLLWPGQPKPARQIHPVSLEVDMRLELYKALVAEFARRKQPNRKLAIQLTALFCSSAQDIRDHKLVPTPEDVRKNVSDRRKKAT